MFLVRSAAFLAVLAVAASAQAQTKTVVDVTGVSDGQYLMVISGGVVSVNPIVILVPGPTPDPDPDPDLTEFSQQIKTASLAVPNEVEAKGNLSGVYRLISQQVEDGNLTSREAIEVSVRYMTRAALSVSEQEAMEPIRDVLNAQWAKLTQDGADVSAYGDVLAEAADGIDSSLPGDPQIDLEKLLAILMWFIENILPLFLEAGVTLP